MRKRLRDKLKESFRERPGNTGWVLLALFILLWDVFARETLSEAFRRSLDGDRKRWVVTASWTYITAHLFHILPDDIDPFRVLVTLLKEYLEELENG